MTPEREQAIQAIEALLPFVEAFRVGPGSNEREYEFVGRILESARAALVTLRQGEAQQAPAAPAARDYACNNLTCQLVGVHTRLRV
jgi:hypothetical protein